jgi:hypothetical protein
MLFGDDAIIDQGEGASSIRKRSMNEITSIVQVPNIPAVYAMFAGQRKTKYVAYVGLAGKLRSRLEQHLVRKDSSVTTGVTAVSLNPELVTEVQWWEHPDFDKKDALRAAELVAFDVLEPVLRGRGTITDRAKKLYDSEPFYRRTLVLFKEEAAGRLVIHSASDTRHRLADHEARLRALELQVAALKKRKT